MSKSTKSTFPKKARDWIDSRASKDTRLAYNRDLKLWLDFCKNPDSPTIREVVDFRDGLQKKHAPLSVRRTLACLSAMYTAVGKENPFSEKRLPRPPASRYHKTAAVSDEHARALIEAAGSIEKTPLRDQALIWLLWTTGMRRVSAVSIQRDGILKIGDAIIARHVVKGGEEEESELTQDTLEAIQRWLNVAPKSRWVFCTPDGGPLTPSAVSKIVAKAAREAGLEVSPHMFRSAAATSLLDAGTPIEGVRAFLHHKDIRSTLRYDRGQRAAGLAEKLAEFRKKY